jgi:hypothetical protein
MDFEWRTKSSNPPPSSSESGTNRAPTLPFGIAQETTLRPVIHSGSFISAEVPVWDIAENFGDTNLLVSNMAQAPRPREMPRRQ